MDLGAAAARRQRLVLLPARPEGVGPWSPIHILSVFTPLALVYAVWAARHQRVRGHRIAMISIFCGALVIAGLFTLVPGRLMHAVVFGAR